MNLILEQKLKNLMDEAEQQGSGATYVVLHLLLGAHHSGQHHEFAKHCCKFSDVQLQTTADVSDQTNDFPEESKGNTYLN